MQGNLSIPVTFLLVTQSDPFLHIPTELLRSAPWGNEGSNTWPDCHCSRWQRAPAAPARSPGRGRRPTVSVPPATTSHARSGARPAPAPASTRQAFGFEASARPPQIVDTGTDLIGICSSLIDFSQWLYAHDPDEALIPRFAAPASRTAAAAHNDLANLHRWNRRLYEVESRSRRTR